MHMYAASGDPQSGAQVTSHPQEETTWEEPAAEEILEAESSNQKAPGGGGLERDSQAGDRNKETKKIG